MKVSAKEFDDWKLTIPRLSRKQKERGLELLQDQIQRQENATPADVTVLKEKP